MKELRLDWLTLSNYRGISEVTLEFGGRDAEIIGENGTGKTTIAQAYEWLLTGGRGEVEPVTGGGVSVVEAAFTNGTVLRRELNGSSTFYVNGSPQKAKEYAVAVGELTNGTAGLLVMPQKFCELHWEKRRGLVLAQFGAVRLEEVIAAVPELSAIAGLLERWSPEQIIANGNGQIRQVRQELAGIPARIDELSRRVKALGEGAALRAEIEALEAAKASAAEKRSAEEATAARSQVLMSEAEALRREVYEAGKELRTKSTAFTKNEGERDKLRQRWYTLHNALEGKCPLCGAEVSGLKAQELRRELKSVESAGKALAATQSKISADMAAETARIEEKQARAEELQREYSERLKSSGLAAAREESAALERQLEGLKARLGALGETQARIDELKARELELNAGVSEVEARVHLARRYLSKKMEMIEGAVNSQFERVRFRLYEEYKTTENVRECCEPEIDGVAYGELSKGERLVAALDILKAFQRSYGVQLPVFIDDAESYTSNSAIELTNQVIRLKAVEGAKALEVRLL